jgi:hypothetical protein
MITRLSFCAALAVFVAASAAYAQAPAKDAAKPRALPTEAKE